MIEYIFNNMKNLPPDFFDRNSIKILSEEQEFKYRVDHKQE